MRIDVLLGEALPTPHEVLGKVVVVIDVLRAATTVVTALANGARAVIPFDSVDEPVTLSKQYERSEYRLAGERKMQRIDGFDLGNSPLEYTRPVVQGRTILYSTTNGTVALVASTGSAVCYFAAFVNCSETIKAARAASRDDIDVLIVCAGHERRVTLEDVVCAGRIARGLARGRSSVKWTDGARSAALLERRYATNFDKLRADATHARSLAIAGFEADVEMCFSLDTQPLVVTYQDRQLRGLDVVPRARPDTTRKAS
ncbi:MAG: 2-phosphosulfolactate phosphatase [Gemmatimonadaceae bacterium]